MTATDDQVSEPERPATVASAPETASAPLAESTVDRPDVFPAELGSSRPDPAQPATTGDGKVRRVMRWVLPLAVFALVGSAAGFAVAMPRRTDVPGLRTPADGRYVFAPLRLPALPQGSPGPLAADNPSHAHLADIRELLLQQPVGAVPVNDVAEDGWTSQSSFGSLEAISTVAVPRLGYDGNRHIAARGWHTPDGATTDIYLVQFGDSDMAANYFTNDRANSYLAATDATRSTTTLVDGTSMSTAASPSQGSRTARVGEFQVGDTVAVVIFEAPSKVGPAPFDQILTLQSELLR